MKPRVIGAELAFESVLPPGVKKIHSSKNRKKDGEHLICPKCLFRFKFIDPNRSVQCPQCKTQGFFFPDKVPTCPGCRTKGQCIIVDGIHWKVWVPLPADAMAKFEESI
jgi:hypothetical protein